MSRPRFLSSLAMLVRGARPSAPGRVALLAALAAAAALGLAACGDDGPADAGAATAGASAGTAPGPGAHGAGAAPAGFPVSVSSCGREVAVDAAPQRALAMEQGATEVLLSLGLADAMAGTAYRTDPILPALADDYARVETLAGQYPSHERVLDAEPDFVYSMRASAFAPDAAGTRERLRALGVPAYLSRFDCEQAGDTVDRVTFDGLFAEVEEVARLFGVPERGEELVARQRGRLERAVAAAPAAASEPPTLLWHYAGTRVPYVAGCCGLPSTVSELVGARNVFDDLDQPWPEGSWEEIAARDPDAIVLADLTRGGDGDSAAAKRRFLRADPVASQLTAVRAGRFIVVAGSAMDPSVRSVAAVEQVAAGLRRLEARR